MPNYDQNVALIVVDVQNDFADPEGSLYVLGAEEALERINAEVERAHAAGAAIVYTQDWHPPATPHFQKDGGIWPVHCVAETWGAALHAKLAITDAVLIRKGTAGEDGYSAFSLRDPRSGAIHATELDAQLRERDVRRLVVVGLATDYCVKETVLDAARLGYETTVLEAAIRGVELQEGDSAQALAAMRAAGAQVDAG